VGIKRFSQRSGVVGKDFLAHRLADQADAGRSLYVFVADELTCIEGPLAHACQFRRATYESGLAGWATSGRDAARVLLQGGDADEFRAELLANRIRVFVLERGEARNHTLRGAAPGANDDDVLAHRFQFLVEQQTRAVAGRHERDYGTDADDD